MEQIVADLNLEAPLLRAAGAVGAAGTGILSQKRWIGALIITRQGKNDANDAPDTQNKRGSKNKTKKETKNPHCKLLVQLVLDTGTDDTFRAGSNSVSEK